MYIYIENGKLIGCGECPQVTEDIENIKVSEDIYNAYLAEPEKYIFENAKVIVNPDYDVQQAQKEREARILQIKHELAELDTKRIRAMCEPSERDDGQDWLEYYNEQAQALRAELQELEERTENDDNFNK